MGCTRQTAAPPALTSEVERELRSSTRHIETMHLDRLIGLWEDRYDRIRKLGKALLPLVFFLAPPKGGSRRSKSLRSSGRLCGLLQ